MPTEFAFKPVTFKSCKRSIAAPVSASVNKSSKGRVSFRLKESVLKTAKLAPGDALTPFLDIPNRAILLLSGQRPLPDSSRKIYETTGTACVIEFPRCDGFDKLFPGIAPAIGLEMVECMAGRILLVVPRVKDPMP